MSLSGCYWVICHCYYFIYCSEATLTGIFSILFLESRLNQYQLPFETESESCSVQNNAVNNNHLFTVYCSDYS